KALQGNLDPAALLAPPAEIERRVAELLAEGRGGPHIVNLGHGILPATPVEHARAFVAAAQRLSVAGAAAGETAGVTSPERAATARA
ncbi:MAG TPA: uroporphyrinogen decarboxylase family protein, partial [Thermoanaerobaculia bacterium]